MLLRRYRDFGGCEDAVQEALIAAATQWPTPGDARQPERLADHRGDPSPHRSDPLRHGAPAARAAGGEPDSGGRADRPCCRRRRHQRTRRDARPVFHVLPLRAVGGVPGRPDAASGRWSYDRRNRARVLRTGSHDGAAADTSETDHQVGWYGVSRAHAFRSCGSPAGCPQGDLSDFQRGLHAERRRPACTASICHRKRFASPACSLSCCRRIPRSAACSR